MISALKRNLRIKAAHIKGCHNTRADSLSRKTRDHSYSLPNDLFSHIYNQIIFKPTIDLFASRLNKKLPIYYSEGPDPFASNFDAFCNPWPNSVYAFPPIKLGENFIARFLQLNIEFGLLICPFWPSQPFFATLLNILFDKPFLIPAHMVEDPATLPQNLSGFLACSSTLRTAKSRAFQRKQQPVYSEVLNPLHYVATYEHGNLLPIGVVNKKCITALCL